MKTLVTILCWFIPIKKLRRRLKLKYVKGTPIKYSNGNTIILHTETGKNIKNPYMIHGLDVHFCGKNSVIELFLPINFYKSEFNIMDNCKFVIRKFGAIGMRIDADNNSSVFIDENADIGKVFVHMENESGTSLVIGKNVALSYDIEIYTTDTHPVLDMQGNVINNKKASVVIQDHVWVCASAVLLKGAYISSDSIVGHSAVVSGKFSEKNVAIAGNPAKIVKRDINWRGGKIG